MNASMLGVQIAAISGATEVAVRVLWADAWATYFSTAQAGTTPFAPLAPGRLTEAKVDMAVAMVGLSVPGQAAAKVQAGIIAWWDCLVSHPAAYFAGATAITKPPGLTCIAADLPPSFATDRSGQLSIAVLHSHNAGGAADISGSQTIA
jgi:hypothetical protein